MLSFVLYFAALTKLVFREFIKGQGMGNVTGTLRWAQHSWKFFLRM